MKKQTEQEQKLRNENLTLKEQLEKIKEIILDKKEDKKIHLPKK